MAFKSSTLFKKSSGNGLFKRYGWTPRHCRLTSTSLEYFTHQDGKLKGAIDLTECTVQSFEALPTDCLKYNRSASTAWRLAIQTPTHKYFVATSSERDMHEWLRALQAVVKLNEMRWMQPYHGYTHRVRMRSLLDPSELISDNYELKIHRKCSCDEYALSDV